MATILLRAAGPALRFQFLAVPWEASRPPVMSSVPTALALLAIQITATTPIPVRTTGRPMVRVLTDRDGRTTNLGHQPATARRVIEQRGHAASRPRRSNCTLFSRSCPNP